jgi:hypothetical protein
MNRKLYGYTPIAALCLVLAHASMVALSGLSAADTSTKELKTAKLPPAREIVANYLKAIGGREAILKQTSHHSTGKMEMAAQGITGSLEVFAAKPNKVLVISKLPGIGEVRQGYDGKVGWSIDPMQGPMLLKDKALEQMREQADFYGSLHDEKAYSLMETADSTPFEGMDCYKLKLVKKTGADSEEYYDKKTGLLVGMTAKQDTPLGVIPVTSVLSDYREFDGVKVPTRISQKIMGIQQVMTIEKVEVNNLADSVFEVPDQIKTLLKPANP